MSVCPSCGHRNQPGAKFCSECGLVLTGVRLPTYEERKVVTVLFADLVGFTSRAEQMDPEDVRALLSPFYARLRSELERFGGTVEKFIGDAVMALFGAPVAHEDDPERAVLAALAIRDWVRGEERIQVRLAVNTGEALVTLGARPSEGEGMAAGDVVNTAARLQAARGDTEAALQDQRESLISGRQAEDPQILFEALGVSAYVLALLGRADEAQLLLSELFGTSAFNLGGLDEASMDCVLAAEILGRRDQARPWLSTRRDCTWYVAARALTDQEFVAAAEVLDSMGAARSAALVRLRAAQEFVRTGRQAEADDQLRRALGFFRSVDATRFIREAEALLASPI